MWLTLDDVEIDFAVSVSDPYREARLWVDVGLTVGANPHSHGYLSIGYLNI